MNPLTEIPIMLEDLEMFHTTLAAVNTYLEAKDMAKCQLNMLPSYRTSPLTQDVAVSLTRVKGLMGDYLLSQHLQVDDEEEELEEEVEEEEALPDSPFGEPEIKKAPKRVSDDAESIQSADDEDGE